MLRNPANMTPLSTLICSCGCKKESINTNQHNSTTTVYNGAESIITTV